jgi:threonine synthase
LLTTEGLNGVRNVWVKNESANPTWSYKDRMCAVGVSAALEARARIVGVSSTGNQGASAAAYAAKAGLGAVVLTREDIRDPTLAFLQVYGALVLQTTRYGRWSLLRHGVESLGWYPLSSFTPEPTGNPFAVEGYKTIAYEILDELGRSPDVVVVPTCYGEGLAGIYAGFAEMAAMGRISDVPRMVAAEPAAGAPLYKTLSQHLARVLRVDPYETIATSLGATASTDRALVVLRESGGGSIPVTDDELVSAQAKLIREGIFGEYSGVAAVAALPHLAASLPGIDPDAATVVVLMTGGGLRQLPALRASLPPVQDIEPTPEALEAAMKAWQGRVADQATVQLS